MTAITAHAKLQVINENTAVPTPRSTTISDQVTYTKNSYLPLLISKTKHQIGELTQFSKNLNSVNNKKVYVSFKPVNGFSASRSNLFNTLFRRNAGFSKASVNLVALDIKPGKKIELSTLRNNIEASLNAHHALLKSLESRTAPVTVPIKQPVTDSPVSEPKTAVIKPTPAKRTVFFNQPATATPIPKLRQDKPELTAVMDAYINQPQESAAAEMDKILNDKPRIVGVTLKTPRAPSPAPTALQKDDPVSLTTKRPDKLSPERFAFWERVARANTPQQ